jgi:hypothetical protein
MVAEAITPISAKQFARLEQSIKGKRYGQKHGIKDLYL